MIRSVFKSGAFQVIGFGFGFILHVLLARMIAVEAYGLYNFVFAFSSILAMVAMFGLPQSGIRFIQEYTAKNNLAGLRGFLQFSRWWPLVLGAITGLGAYIILFFLMKFKGGDAGYLTLHVAIAGAALVPLMALLRVHSAVLRGFQKISASVFYETTYRDVAFVCLIMAGIAVPDGAAALMLLLLVLAFGTVVSGLHAAAQSRVMMRGIKPVFEIRRWLEISWPMMLTVATRVLMVRTDLIVLGFMAGAAALGVYAGAVRFSMLISLSQMAVMPFFMAHCSRYYQSGKHAELRSLFFKAQFLQALGGVALVAALLLMGKPMLMFLGPDYVAGYGVLLILTVGQMIGVACGPSSAILQMTEYEKQAMQIVLFFALSNLILTPVLVVLMGIEGAAVATSLCFTGQNVVSYVVAWRKGLISREAAS